MTALFVVLMVLAFVLVDVAVRALSRRLSDVRIRREREAALQVSLRLDFTHEAPSLTRVELPDARASVLAVDDESVVLDSFRKILVLEGFNIDTVETGPEALGLVQRKDYDLVFTDLKMPGMDGVEVVKAVRHLRPDVDVAVVTGYGTIESAVETMQYGAVDYVQKPFTEDELVKFTKKLLIKREARLDAQRLPTVQIVAPAMADGAPSHQFCVPGGVFLSPGHSWARIEPDGQVTIGLDDFARKALRAIDGVELPGAGQTFQRGERLFTVRHAASSAHFTSPVSGQVTRINAPLQTDPSSLIRNPYSRGWVCRVQPSDLAGELSTLRIGEPVVSWYQEEVARLRETSPLTEEAAPGDTWGSFEKNFLTPTLAART
jgi:DNA-binding response OmpR family regulator